jgi:CRISPR-associated protein Csm1
MPAQILLQGVLPGIEDFLLAAPSDRDNRVFETRLMWAATLAEVLPRALLAHLSLPPILLGSSDLGGFLVILPDQPRADTAGEFLSRAAEKLRAITGGLIRLIWSSTENLGDWTVVRKRLSDGLRERERQRVLTPGFFDAFDEAAAPPDVLPRGLRDAAQVGWGFDFPALISPEGGEHHWDLGNQASTGNIALTRHAARNGGAVASVKELAKRAEGRKLWGVLRGQIDDFATRMRRLHTVEEHVHFSMLYKQFVAGEIELLCSHGDFFQRVTVLYCGSSEFAVCGSWDALAGFARELQRVFARFAEESLKELPGAEAKTMSMAISIASPGDGLARVWEDCGRDLGIARAADKDCLYMLGRVLEWKQLNDAADLKDAIVRLNEEFRGGRVFLSQLRNLYKKVEGAERADEDRLMARAARFQRRFARVATRREREFQKLRSHLMKEMAGRSERGKLKLRPEGLVALEWARLVED